VFFWGELVLGGRDYIYIYMAKVGDPANNRYFIKNLTTSLLKYASKVACVCYWEKTTYHWRTHFEPK